MEAIATITALAGFTAASALLMQEKRKNAKLRKKLAAAVKRHEKELEERTIATGALQWQLFQAQEQTDDLRRELNRKEQLLRQKWTAANEG